MAILPTSADIRWISDLTGAGTGIIFHPRVRPAPAPRIGECGRGFHFSPMVTRRYPKFQILMASTESALLNFCQPRSFGLAQHYTPLKSCTVTICSVHLTHQLHSSLGSSIHRDLVIEFTSTLLKPVGDSKMDGCGRGCDFSPTGVAADGCRQVFIEPAPLPSIVFAPLVGASGGLITIWNDSLFEGEMLLINSYSVTVKFTCCLSGHIFHVTNIYGAAATADKSSFINWLYNFDTSDIEDWLLFGDFNLIRAPENHSRGDGNANEMLLFNDLIHHLDLVEIQFQGRSFT
jgi:hypothetical protein